MSRNAEELVRRLAAGIRGAELYGPVHPLVQRGVAGLSAICQQLLQDEATLVVGFIGDEVVVNDARQMAAAHCAGYNKWARITSVHARYGDYIAFACELRRGRRP